VTGATAALLAVMRTVSLVILALSTSAVAAPETSAPSDAPAAAQPAPDAGPDPIAAEPAPSIPQKPAPGPTSLSPILVDGLPPACRALGTSASSISPTQALSARISLSSCLVEQKLKALVLCDCEQSVIELDAAAGPSFALLDEVISLGDATQKILALQARGDLLQSFATRILATVPVPVDSSPSALALRQTRLGLITPSVTPWIERSQAAYTELDRIARANPKLAKNPAVLTAVRSSRAKLAQSPGVAKR